MQKLKLIITFSSLFFFVSSLKSQENIERFQGSKEYPEMVVIPKGMVFIDSYPEEIGRKKSERNRIEAHIEHPFTMAKTEVNFGQYRVFIKKQK